MSSSIRIRRRATLKKLGLGLDEEVFQKILLSAVYDFEKIEVYERLEQY